MARGSNSRDGRTARSEAPLRPYTESELKRELKAYPNETRESLIGARNFLIRKEQEKRDTVKRLKEGRPNESDFDYGSGVRENFFKGQGWASTGGYDLDLLKAGAFIKMKDGEILEVEEAPRSRRDKEGEEGWDGSDRSLYVKEVGGGDAQGYRIDDLSKIDAVIPRDWQKRLEGRVARSEDTRSPGAKAAGEAHTKHMRMNTLARLMEYFPPGNPRHEESKAEYLRLKRESEEIRNKMTDKEWRKEVNFYLRTVNKPIDATGKSMLD